MFSTTRLFGILLLLATLMLPGGVLGNCLGPEPQDPLISFNLRGSTTNYVAGTGQFTMSARSVNVRYNGSDRLITGTSGTGSTAINLGAILDQNGNLTEGIAGDDLQIYGQVDMGGANGIKDGLLLSGEVTGFCGVEGGSTDEFALRFLVTGGALASYLLPGQSVVLQLTVETSTFNGSYMVGFSGGAKGSVGPLPYCGLDIEKLVSAVVPPPMNVACSSKIAATLLCYTGPTVMGANVTITSASGAVASYTGVNLTAGAILSAPAQNGYTIDAAVSAKTSLGTTMTISINGGVGEAHHTSCSTPYVVGKPAPLNNPKGNPSPLWFVKGFRDESGVGYMVQQPPPPSSSLEVRLPSRNSVMIDGKNFSISFRYTGGGASASANIQDGDSVDGMITGSLAATVQPKDKNAPSFVVQPAGEFILNNKDAEEIKLTNAGGTEKIKIKTDGKQPLRVGDVFGSLTVTAINNVGLGGVKVNYTYIVTNNGSPLTGIVLNDNEFMPSQIEGPFDLATGHTAIFDMMTEIFQDTTGTVDATGYLASGEACSDTSTSTVTVGNCESELGTVERSGDKIRIQIKNGNKYPITLSKVTATFPLAAKKLKEIKLNDAKIFDTGIATSPAVVTNYSAKLAEVQIPAGSTGLLEVKFESNTGDAGAGFGVKAEFDEGCSLEVSPGQVPDQPFTCTKPMKSLSMIWAGTEAVRIKAYNGNAGSLLLADIDLIQPGDTITVSGYNNAPNDVIWEVFQAGTTTLIGTSTFHLSCSDDDMDGPEDCGKAAGNGKQNEAGYINTWILAGMEAGPFSFSCVPGQMPTEPFTCAKPVKSLTMVWGGAQTVRIKAYNGAQGSSVLKDMDNIVPGTAVTVSGYNNAPNDVVWEVFQAGPNGSLLGLSKFHISCSDSDMDGPEDCGKREGNGKNNEAGLINDWYLKGMEAGPYSFSCP